MKTCMWCGKSTDKLYKIASNGEIKGVCRECAVSNKKNTCRICGELLGRNSINGVCLICAQTELTEKNRELEEIANTGGVGTIGSPSEFTDSDMKRWLGTRQPK